MFGLFDLFRLRQKDCHEISVHQLYHLIESCDNVSEWFRKNLAYGNCQLDIIPHSQLDIIPDAHMDNNNAIFVGKKGHPIS